MADLVIHDNNTAQPMSTEEAFAALDQLLGRLENGQLPLEEAFAGYKEGMTLIRSLNETIDGIEKQLKVLNEEDNEHV